MKKSALILIMFLANATFAWSQPKEADWFVGSGDVDHYAGKTSVDDGFEGTWNVENVVYVAGTGEDRKEHSVYILRRPSNMAGELPDTTNCKNRQIIKNIEGIPYYFFMGEATYFTYEGIVTIQHRLNTELLIYYWWDEGDVKEVAFWFPVGSGHASLAPRDYLRIERNIKAWFSYEKKEPVAEVLDTTN